MNLFNSTMQPFFEKLLQGSLFALSAGITELCPITKLPGAIYGCTLW